LKISLKKFLKINLVYYLFNLLNLKAEILLKVGKGGIVDAQENVLGMVFSILIHFL